MSRSGPTSTPDGEDGGETYEEVEAGRVVRDAVGIRPLFGPRQVVSVRVEKLRDEVASLEREVAELRSQADRLVAERLREAEGEIERKKSEAHAIALQGASGEIRQMLTKLGVRHDEKMRLWDHEVPGICIDIARQILRLEIEDSDRAAAAWRGLIAEAMRQVRRQRAVTIKVHPDYVGVLEAAAADLASTLPMASVPEVRASDELDRGEAVVETAAGRISVSIEQGLSKLEDEGGGGSATAPQSSVTAAQRKGGQP